MSRGFPLPAVVVMALALLQPFAIRLQAAVPDDDAPTAELDTITVTATRRERPLREVANSISVIDAERISETITRDIKELARYTPWLSVSNDPSRFGAEGFTIRGIGANRVATEIDGVPVANGFSVGSYSSSRRDAINPAMVKRMEVLRGPASALYGSDAIGGVVSYTTWQPDDFLLGKERPWHLGTTIVFDSRDESTTATVTGVAGMGEFDTLLAATLRSGHETDNTSTSVESMPNPREYDQADLAGKIVRTTTRGSLALTLDYRHARALTQVDNLEGQGRFASTTFLQGNDRQDRKRVALNGNMRLENNLLHDIDWGIYFQETVTDQRSIEERAASRRSPSPTRRYPEFRYREAIAGLDLTVARDLDFDRVAHRMLYGLQIRQRRVAESRDNRLLNLDTGESTNEVLGETFPVRDFPVSRISEFALFAHDEIVLADARLTLIPGLRAEYYRLEPRADDIYTADNPGTAVVSIDEFSLTPKLGAVMQIDERISLFAQYARGFRSPPFEDANIGLEIPLFNVRAIPNPDLQPETSDGYELGMRFLGTRVQGTISAYYNDYEDFIETKVNLGPDPDTGVLTFQSQNRERARIHGFEADLNIDLNQWLNGLTLHGGLATARGDDKVRNEPLNTVDPDRATLGLRFDHPGQRWGTELIASFADAKTRVDDSDVDVFKPAGYTVFDLFTYFRFTPQARLNLGFFNLGDRQYFDWADVRGRPADDPLLGLYTRPGFNFAANLRIDW